MYLFPFSQIKQNSNIIIYGAGDVGSQYYEQIKQTVYCNVICFVDKNPIYSSINGLEIKHPDKTDFNSCEYVVVAIEDKSIAEIVKYKLLEKNVKNVIWEIIKFNGAKNNDYIIEYSSYSMGNPPEHVALMENKQDLRNLIEVLKVYTYDGIRLVRIGNDADGGYIMDDNMCGNIAYSIGIGDEISWDCCMANKGYDVYMYDYTIDSLPYENSRFHFEKKGITGRNNPNSVFCTLKEALVHNKHMNEQNMILKMDIEGAEWEVLELLDEEILGQFEEIILEVHQLLKTQNWELYANCLRKISKSHSLIHIHANNVGKYALIDGLRLPDMLEITYVKIKSDINYELTNDYFPRNIDKPNIKGKDELDLRNWNSLIRKLLID